MGLDDTGHRPHRQPSTDIVLACAIGPITAPQQGAACFARPMAVSIGTACCSSTKCRLSGLSMDAKNQHDLGGHLAS
jgi:hypothetical protein